MGNKPSWSRRDGDPPPSKKQKTVDNYTFDARTGLLEERIKENCMKTLKPLSAYTGTRRKDSQQLSLPDHDADIAFSKMFRAAPAEVH